MLIAILLMVTFPLNMGSSLFSPTFIHLFGLYYFQFVLRYNGRSCKPMYLCGNVTGVQGSSRKNSLSAYAGKIVYVRFFFQSAGHIRFLVLPLAVGVSCTGQSFLQIIKSRSFLFHYHSSFGQINFHKQMRSKHRIAQRTGQIYVSIDLKNELPF